MVCARLWPSGCHHIAPWPSQTLGMTTGNDNNDNLSMWWPTKRLLMAEQRTFPNRRRRRRATQNLQKSFRITFWTSEQSFGVLTRSDPRRRKFVSAGAPLELGHHESTVGQHIDIIIIIARYSLFVSAPQGLLPRRLTSLLYLDTPTDHPAVRTVICKGIPSV